jgi:heterotetrameric sarcosine oxidase gamma subunit
MSDRSIFTARTAFRTLSATSPSLAGVTILERDRLQIATVIARDPSFGPRVKACYDVDVPTGPHACSGPSVTFLGIGPRTWLAQREGGVPLTEELSDALGDCAAIADQSDGYAVLRIWGDRARAAFEKGLSIDLHPRSFGPGDVAVTTCSHVGVIVHQVDDEPTYDIAMFRSYASAFCHWLTESAAEYGLAVIPDARA